MGNLCQHELLNSTILDLERGQSELTTFNTMKQYITPEYIKEIIFRNIYQVTVIHCVGPLQIGDPPTKTQGPRLIDAGA
jgi:hypothetical protein